MGTLGALLLVLKAMVDRVDVKRRVRNTNIKSKSSKSSPKVLLSHCSRVDNKRRIRNANIKSSKSCPAASCHTEKTHLQSQTTPCLTSFDPGPCDRSALFSCQVTQAPAPSLWMASILRRLSSGRPPQQRLHTLMLSNPPLPIHRQPRSRCATLLPSSGVRNSRWSGSGGFRTQARHRCISQT